MDISGMLTASARELGELPLRRSGCGFLLCGREKAAADGVIRSVRSLGRAAIRRTERGQGSVFDEQLADGFYRLEKQLALLAEQPRSAFRRLPVMAAGKWEGRPRILALAECIARCCGEVSLAAATVFLEEYQERHGLSTREIRLLPEMLRLALLRKTAALIRKAKTGYDGGELQKLLAGFDTVSEADFAEGVAALDPAGRLLDGDADCRRMDSESRESYLEAAARIGGSCGVSAQAAVRTALSLAERAEGGEGTEDGAPLRRKHAGYYLIAEGRDELIAALRPGKTRRGKRCAARTGGWKLTAFIGAKLALAAAAAALCGILDGCFFSAMLILVPALAAADVLLIRILTRFTRPRHLPRLAPEYVRGQEQRTLVAVPVLITGEKALIDAVKTLERHYLANRRENAEYCVLGDFPDSETPQKEGEAELLQKAEALIAALNADHPAEHGARFHYMHRRRTLNAADGLYMGRERKRGAVEALLSYIEKGTDGEFSLNAPELPRDFHYLCVLDADTVMPNGALARLIGAATHPLNRPAYAEQTAKKPYAGYNIIVPRMASTSRSAAKSRFAALVSGESGMSAYSSEVSDFFFDSFDSGNFGGKGLIDIAGFIRATEGRIAPNTVLSHDLLEGSLAGAAFAGSTVLYDGEPASYIGWRQRRHRWLRGDTQLLPYIFGKNSRGLDAVSRYKMLANLFGGFVDPALFEALMLALVFRLPAVFYAALSCFFIDPLVTAGSMLIRLLTGERTALRPLVLLIRRRLMEFCTLPYAALRDSDAVGRSLWRMAVSHKKMLEWRTAADSGGDGSRYGKLWPCPAAGFAFAALACFGALTGAGPFIGGFFAAALFFIAQPVVRRLDGVPKKYAPDAEEKALLSDIAKRTWRFFDDNITEQSRFLPPDNLQQRPEAGAAMQTSPTNIGMALLAAVCAKDLGFIDGDGLLLRLDRTVETVEKLEKWRGLPFNWYSCADLSLLKPRFVSSVDCGNLFCCLVTAAAAVSELAEEELALFDPAFAAELARRMRALAENMELEALFNARRRLFYIGLDFEQGRPTPAHYDLWASEARILSFAAVAWAKTDARHWFTLGRLACDAPGGRCLKSWSGTAFEYLMPLIFFDTAEGSLQREVVRSAVLTQILTAEPERPWGVSESGYYAFDAALRYRYRAFGTPELALAREKEKQAVVAPYASALALLAEPKEAAANIRRLVRLGALGEYGLYEALDYTKSRVGEKEFRIVESFMAHHQGMALCAIADVLTSGKLRRRFMSIPNVAANEQLLFENMPVNPIKINSYRRILRFPTQKRGLPPIIAGEGEKLLGLLTGENYSVLMTADGRGCSRSGETLITRYRPDSGAVHGIRFAVCTGRTAKIIGGEMTAETHKLVFRDRVGALAVTQEVLLPGGREYGACEMRTLTLSNRGRGEAVCRVGAFAEIALAAEAEDLAHPAFVRVTVDSERAEGTDTVLFTSRKRPGRAEKTAFFSLVSPREAELCTDGLVRPGRGGDIVSCLRAPEKFGENGELPVTQPVEPWYSAVTELRIPAGGSERIILLVGAADSRASALENAANLRKRLGGGSMEAVARARAAQRLAELNCGRRELCLAALLGYRLFTDTPAGKTALLSEKITLRGKSSLWRFGISGERPLVVVPVSRMEELAGAELIARAMRLIHASGQAAELVFIGDYPNEYGEKLRPALEGLLGNAGRLINGFDITAEERAFIIGCALVFLSAEDPFAALAEEPRRKQRKVKQKTESMRTVLPDAEAGGKLTEFNGFGGFDSRRGEYRILLREGMKTPLPWSNVIAGGALGTLVTESGGGYTFAGNARLKRLTPWTNDSVGDRRGERLVLTDVRSGKRLCLPPENGEYECAHGCFYTRFSLAAEGLELCLTLAADAEKPIKYYCLETKNTGTEVRGLVLSLSADPVLGEYLKRETKRWELTERGILIDDLLTESDERAFLAVASGGRLTASEAGETTPPTIAAAFKAAPGETAKTVLILGCAAASEVRKCIDGADFDAALQSAREFRQQKLQRLRLRTGRQRFDTLVNGPLLYQLYSARLLARTGFSQSGGATGFRDQLQDVSALLLTDPERAKRQLLACAAKQFPEGDVLHWWHGDGRGVRTRISDDRLFLPLVACEYAETTGDVELFSRFCPFLESIPIPEDRRDLYASFTEEGGAELMEHCCRAVELSFKSLGKNGLPLMGSGDWNDGMDRVGDGGGESLVTAFLLVIAAERLAGALAARGNSARAEGLRADAAALRAAIEKTRPETGHYPRAIYADGTPLRVTDCVTACFAVFAGAEHGREDFLAALEQLEDGEHGLIKLLAPPFSAAEGQRNVGYIEGYLPGVRENGGQYTHAAAWCVIAACRLGLAETAERLFDMLDPLNHADAAGIERYKAEPYALCGDVYSIGRLAGRGGWSLYTGAAGWLYRAAAEHILGVKKCGDTLEIRPCTTLDRFGIEYCFGERGRTKYRILAVRGEEETGPIPLLDDGRTHGISVKYK